MALRDTRMRNIELRTHARRDRSSSTTSGVHVIDAQGSRRRETLDDVDQAIARRRRVLEGGAQATRSRTHRSAR